MASTSDVTPSEKPCVIIGGGHAGQLAAKELVKVGVNPVIVQANAFTEWPISGSYYLTRQDKWDSMRNTKKGSCRELAHTAIEGVKYVVGTVVGVDGGALLFKDNRRLPFAALILAVGHHYPALTPVLGESIDDRKVFVQDFSKRVKAAKSILIGGAGPVALEVASDLRRLNADCKIQLVTSAPASSLLRWSGAASRHLLARLKKTKIEILSGSRLALSDEISGTEPVFGKRRYELKNGQVVEDVDIFLPFFGSPRTDFLNRDLVAKRGKVKTNASGQSTVQENVFAVGCGDYYKLAVMDNFKKESVVVAQNVKNLLDGKALSAELAPEKASASVDYVHLGVGTFSVMNLEKNGCFPGFCGRFCGCCNPICPCCGMCGWPCMFPASEIGGKFTECLLMKMGGNPHHYHAATTPEMYEMER